MSYFTTRVELHDATSASDYNRLHKEMENEGFWLTIQLQGPNQPRYQLPTAEYNKVGDYQINQILEDAKRAAAKTGFRFAVLVTKAEENRAWYGLKQV